MLAGGDGRSGLGTGGEWARRHKPGSGRGSPPSSSPTAPSNVPVGEGAVWAPKTQDKTVSRIDPRTKAVTGRLEVRGVPTDIAAGRRGLGRRRQWTLRQLHVEPKTSTITRTVRLPQPVPAASSTERPAGALPTSPSAPAHLGRATPTTRSRASIPTLVFCRSLPVRRHAPGRADRSASTRRSTGISGRARSQLPGAGRR